MNKRINKKMKMLLLASSLAVCSFAVANIRSSAVDAKAETLSSMEVLGASVRLQGEATDCGIRFGVAVSSDDYQTITTSGYTVGIAVVFADYDEYMPLFDLTANTLSENYFTGEGVQSATNLRYWDFANATLSAGTEENAGKYVATAAITGIINENKTTERIAYAYVKDSAGNFVNIEKGEARSMTYVAQLACEKNPDDAEFLQKNYIQGVGTTSYTVEHITLNDVGAVVDTQKEKVTNATIGGQTSAIVAKDIEHYEADTANQGNVAAATVYANEHTTLKQYYKPKTYDVSGTLTAPVYEGAKGMDVVAINDATDKEYTLTTAADGKVSGKLPYGNFTVRALGYKETASATVASAGEGLFTLAPKNFAFANNGFTLVGKVTEGHTTIINKLQESGSNQSWRKGAINGVDFLQAGGNSRELYYENFCETEYSVGAFISNWQSRLNTGVTLAESANDRQSGISIRSSNTDAVHILLTINGFKITFGNLNEWGKVYSYVTYDNGDGFMANKGIYDTSRYGSLMQVVRQNNVLSVYVDGAKYLTLDGTNGITAVGDLAACTPTYTGYDAGDIAGKLATILGEDTGNYVGYFAQASQDGIPENYSTFTLAYRSTDVDYFENEESFIMPQAVSVNGVSLENSKNAAHANTSLRDYTHGVDLTSSWGYTYVYGENAMYMQMLYIGGSSSGVSASSIAHARYFSKLANGSFTYEGTFDYNAYSAGKGAPALVLSDGTNSVFFSLELGDGSNLRLTINSTSDGAMKYILGGPFVSTSEEAKHVRTLKLEVDVENQVINIYQKDLTANEENFTLLAAISSSAYTYSGSWGGKDCLPTVGALLTSLKEGKDVALGVGVARGNANTTNTVCKVYDFKVGALA